MKIISKINYDPWEFNLLLTDGRKVSSKYALHSKTVEFELSLLHHSDDEPFSDSTEVTHSLDSSPA